MYMLVYLGTIYMLIARAHCRDRYAVVPVRRRVCALSLAVRATNKQLLLLYIHICYVSDECTKSCSIVIIEGRFHQCTVAMHFVYEWILRQVGRELFN